MTRIIILVEGQTEEMFVREVLSQHLLSFNVFATPIIIGNARRHRNHGGIVGWERAKGDILTYIKQDPSCYVTTMVDYYALPSDGVNGWPGRSNTSQISANQRANYLNAALYNAISLALGPSYNARRFVPYVVMHEFEGLLFSDCGAFARGIFKPGLEADFLAIRSSFVTPEMINDSKATAPSKRVVALMPEYEKPIHGSLAALEIGLPAIRSECPGFDGWVQQLERL